MKELIICFTENRWYSLDISNNDFVEDYNISNRNKYYTFQVSDLIREIKTKRNKKIPEIINIESLDKQFSQKGKDLLDFKKWHILKSLRRENIIKSNYKITDLNEFLLKIKEFIDKLKEAPCNEWDRFNDIELDINKIIHKTSFDGIKIDRDILDEKCVNLHRNIYNIKNELQFSHNIFQPENFDTQASYLKNKNYRILESVEKTVSLLRKSDGICKQFNRLNKLNRDLKTLMILKSRLGGNNYVNPYFVGFGTVTSRIIIKEPSLQNLKKENRNIIIPNEGKELFYVDYSQFEASILAHLSSDNKLLKLISVDDIYSDIVAKIYNIEVTKSSRKEAKILFYRFLYGDTFENNLKFKEQVKNYFMKFSELSKFKENLIKESIENGYVKTENGNIRKLDINNDNVWILSHFIQSKASYIFKKAIIGVFKKVKDARLLIPLHDGALYEIDIEDSENIKDQIKNIFSLTLKNECNSLTNIKVKEEKFYKN
ncbi:DNA polymerase I-like protein with 3'-5' exonuclease and polymerase domains [Tenacibaculum gallaicum]|uniref:DNA polymerase I-like protein with 3'-5' exonuclease and polymerase domains n=1 Tax=Tenacibaculum gallaicum TaxID=561505 RepID=A0A3E0HDQ0_9FLAO|nr:DNA polymerase [Tenacibaculum gallaicum]REH43391.1 DNA polymerase I-like protein with 3'-5' exonuclease and polymerase domains [Tenacibaculum gallaicum]